MILNKTSKSKEQAELTASNPAGFGLGRGLRNASNDMPSYLKLKQVKVQELKLVTPDRIRQQLPQLRNGQSKERPEIF